jgi:phosphoserine/homoserine phosphotransferase
MVICCLDLEGVLVPEIWIAVAEETGIEDLRLTTRDIPDYDELMQRRLATLKRYDIKLAKIQEVIGTLAPLPGAREFLDELRSRFQVIILSDTYYEFASPLMRQLDWPTLFCNWLEIDSAGYIADYKLRQSNGKEKAVKGLQGLGFSVRASGDSYNDLTMLKAADMGVLFRPPASIVEEYPQFPVVEDHPGLLDALCKE